MVVRSFFTWLAVLALLGATFPVNAALPPVAAPLVAQLDQTKALARREHTVQMLVRPVQARNGFFSFVGHFTGLDYAITGVHRDQEMFFVLEGEGVALIGDKEVPIRAGSCWVVPPDTVHGIKRTPESTGVRVFVVHGAP